MRDPDGRSAFFFDLTRDTCWSAFSEIVSLAPRRSTFLKYPGLLPVLKNEAPGPLRGFRALRQSLRFQRLQLIPFQLRRLCRIEVKIRVKEVAHRIPFSARPTTQGHPLVSSDSSRIPREEE